MDINYKLILVHHIGINKETEVKIEINKTIGDLKNKIENVFNCKIKGALMLIKKARRHSFALIDENQIIADAHIHNFDRIIIGKDDVPKENY